MRMNEIYDDCADFAFTEFSGQGVRVPYDPSIPAESCVSHAGSRHRAHSPATPFNFLDGSWLRNIHRSDRSMRVIPSFLQS